jgi:hypothetical protein
LLDSSARSLENDALQYISENFSELQTLCINTMVKVTDEGFVNISKLKKLTWLQARSLPEITPKVLELVKVAWMDLTACPQIYWKMF